MIIAPFTVARIKQLVLQRCQLEGSKFINTATELLDYVNLACEEHYAHISSVREEAVLRPATIQVPAAAKVRLPSDFDKLSRLDVILGGYRYPLKEIERDDVTRQASGSWSNTYLPKYQLRFSGSVTALWCLYFDLKPASTYTLTMLYRPVWKKVTANLSDVIRLPFMDGVILRAAKRCLDKKGANTQSIAMDIERLEQKVEIWASNQDENRTRGIRDVREEYDERRRW